MMMLKGQKLKINCLSFKWNYFIVIFFTKIISVFIYYENVKCYDYNDNNYCYDN